MMDHALRTISYIADIGDLLVVMARRGPVAASPSSAASTSSAAISQTKICCHIFESDEVCFIYTNFNVEFHLPPLGHIWDVMLVWRKGSINRTVSVLQYCVHLNSTIHLMFGTLHSTSLPWLPVLSNIEPPALRRKAATDRVEKIIKHNSWPIQPDVLSPPLLRLTSRKPLWLDLCDIRSEWRHNWKSTQVVNSHLVRNPTIRQPGFDLPRQQWSLLNNFCTEQGHCGACRRKWRLTDTDLCPCGETQMMSRIGESCPLTKLNGGLSRLHSVDEDAVSWLTS